MLFVDVSRPLQASLSLVNELVIAHIAKSSFISGAIDGWRAWDARHGKSLDRYMRCQEFEHSRILLRPLDPVINEV